MTRTERLDRDFCKAMDIDYDNLIEPMKGVINKYNNSFKVVMIARQKVLSDNDFIGLAGRLCIRYGLRGWLKEYINKDIKSLRDAKKGVEID